VRIATKLRDSVSSLGIVRIDSAAAPAIGLKSRRQSERIAETFRQACDIAKDFGERLAAGRRILLGGMHSWKRMCSFWN